MKIKNKVAINLLSLTLVCLFAIGSSCNKNETTAIGNSQIGQFLQEGNWRISYFVISKSDRTSQFNGYVFTFNINNTVSAMQGGTASANGTWSISQNKNNGGEFLVLNFGNQFFFQELNGEWFSNNANTIRIALENIIGSASNVDYLTFEKI